MIYQFSYSKYQQKKIIIIEPTTKMMDEQQPQTLSHNRKTPNILVTGTPGTGKTTIATLLNQSLSFKYINIGQLVTQQHLYKQFDQQFNVPIFDEDMVLDYIQEEYKNQIQNGGLVVDFHSSDFFPLRYFDLVVLMRCCNDKLYVRLQERGYQQNKIMENVNCEIMQVVRDQVYEAYPESIIVELVNEEREDMEKNLGIVIDWLVKWKESRNNNNNNQMEMAQS